MRIAKKVIPALAAIAGSLLLWGGCALMPQEEPVPEELAILFTASTGGEFEACG